ncbi:acylphosphatase [Phytoactinopolyspora limicola]|uniref:acylphosphatase n=1 Tax=Phytoactinopolyspora limicola TaxID=2715536 RepID=UPI001407A4D2|nr:acylphosphatase [Phytoactinopolyspora limicola]
MNERLHIERIHLYEYAVPNAGASRAVDATAYNLVIHLHAMLGGTPVEGVGEISPRGPRYTGDARAQVWPLVVSACELLDGRSLPVSGPEELLHGVRSIMAELRQHAADVVSATGAGNPKKPYRATLAGIEQALLDALARARDVPLVDVLGRARQHVQVSAATIPSLKDSSALEKRLRNQHSRYPMTRLTSHGEVSADLELIQLAAKTNRAAGGDKPLWLVATEKYQPHQAEDLVDHLLEWMRSDDPPGRLIIEQPLRRDRVHELAELQRHARTGRRRTWRLGRRQPHLSIMASLSVWDEDDLERLHTAGGTDVIAIEIPRSGGLLPSLDIARAAQRRNPDVEISLDGPRSVSQVSASNAHALALSMPRLDYLTISPLRSAVRDITAPELTYLDKSSNILADQTGSGSGTQISLGELGRFVTKAARIPRPVPSAPADSAMPPFNTFDAPHLEKFKKIPLDSHLLEHEALTEGLETLRVSSLIFTARAPGSDNHVAFYRTCGDANSRVARFTTVDKQITRVLLQRAGVSVPEGQQFSLRQRAQAVEYAHWLGWPVVVKPQAGTGGVGVTTNIRSEDEVTWAIDAVAATKHERFVVERHIEGDAYRFIVADNRVLSVTFRQPANVVGDGVSTVAELIEMTNELRRTTQKLQTRPIKLDDRARFQLERQELRWDSVPDAGQTVVLSTAGSITQGGETYQVLEETHPTLLDMAVRSVQAIPGLHISGVDFLISDHRLPLDEQAAGICELNASPAGSSHHFPLFGTPKNISLDLMRAQCRLNGVPLRTKATELCLDLEIRGKIQGVGYRQWMASLATEFGLSGWVRNTAEPQVVQAQIAGPAGPTAALASLAIEGPSQASPRSVRTRHSTDVQPTGRFTVT